jgi:hypothetical protein
MSRSEIAIRKKSLYKINQKKRLKGKLEKTLKLTPRIENGKTDIQLSTLYRLLEFGLGKTVEVSVN